MTNSTMEGKHGQLLFCRGSNSKFERCLAYPPVLDWDNRYISKAISANDNESRADFILDSIIRVASEGMGNLQKFNQGGHNADGKRHHAAQTDGETHFRFFYVAA